MSNVDIIGGGTLKENTKPARAIDPQNITVLVNGEGIDRSLFNMIDWMIGLGTITGTTPTLDLKVQDSADDITYADLAASSQQTGVGTVTHAQLTDADADSVKRFATDLRNAKQFVRIVSTPGGTTPDFEASVVAVLSANQERGPVAD